MHRPAVALSVNQVIAAQARKNGELDANVDPNLIGMLAVSACLTILIEWISDAPAASG